MPIGHYRLKEEQFIFFCLPPSLYLPFLGINQNGQFRETPTQILTPIPASIPNTQSCTEPLYAVPGLTKRSTKLSRLAREPVILPKTTQSIFVLF